jgi:ATP-dependent DNA helicase PIF1
VQDNPHRGIDQHIIDQALLDISQHLAAMGGRTLREFELPVPSPAAWQNSPSVLEQERGRYNQVDQQQVYDTNAPLLNVEQKAVVEAVRGAVDGDLSPLDRTFFVDGPGGTGKTFVYNTILAYVRSTGKIALSCASSGIAALLLDGGRTAHSRFKIPVADLNDSSRCNLSRGTPMARLIQEAAVIVWDEAPMMHKHAFMAVNRTLQDLMEEVDPAFGEMLFGGKVIVLGGDFRQILHVVVKGSPADIMRASLNKSNMWPRIRQFKLRVNMRVHRLRAEGRDAAAQESWAEYLLRIGEGTEQTYPDIGQDMIKLDPAMCCPTEDVVDLINIVYGALPAIVDATARREYLINRAILTCRNVDVDAINEKVMVTFKDPNLGDGATDEKEYLSADSVVDAEHDEMYPVEFLNTLLMSGLPPHKLWLKVGCPIMLLRNLSNGLANGTRLIVKRLMATVIDAEVATGPTAGQRVFIPRLSLSPSNNEALPFTLQRRQFPIRPAFAMTINKSQGQTMKMVGVYLPTPVFSHGHLYVAESRVGFKEGVKIVVVGGRHTDDEGVENVYTRNVVFKPVFDPLWQ